MLVRMQLAEEGWRSGDRTCSTGFSMFRVRHDQGITEQYQYWYTSNVVPLLEYHYWNTSGGTTVVVGRKSTNRMF